jgi:predicted SnoaL-like aldol condensation-catalyzing enzyme
VDGASELNKRKVRLFVEAVLNEGRLELIDELVAADYVGRVPPIERGVHGPEGVRRLVSCARRAHPDLYVKIDDQIAEDDRVATRWRATTNAPVARATTDRGRTPCYAGISIIRLLAGKQVDSHTEYTNVTPSATAEPAKDAESGAPGARPTPPTARG